MRSSLPSAMVRGPVWMRRGAGAAARMTKPVASGAQAGPAPGSPTGPAAAAATGMVGPASRPCSVSQRRSRDRARVRRRPSGSGAVCHPIQACGPLLSAAAPDRASLRPSITPLSAPAKMAARLRRLGATEQEIQHPAARAPAGMTLRTAARIDDSIYVRHWDSWLAPGCNAGFSGVRKQQSTGQGHGESATYSVEGGLHNLVSSIKNAVS